MKNEFPSILKELRKTKRLTQPELCEAIGYSHSIISEWENGKKIPTATAIITLANFFNVTTDYLLGLENEDGTKIKNFEEQPIQLSARSKDNKVKQFTLTQKELEEIIANAIKINNLKE